MSLHPFTVRHPAGHKVSLTPILIAGTPKAPAWLLLAPVQAPTLSPRELFAASLRLFGEAVVLANRYAVYHADYEAEKAAARAARRFGRDLCARGQHIGVPSPVEVLRQDGWPIYEVFQATYTPEWLAHDIRGFALAGGEPGGQLAAVAHAHIVRLGANATQSPVDAGLWPSEACRKFRARQRPAARLPH
ncbi:MAG: hypothetical protein P4M15_10845 [Alphaproteobacteria bacterium]|nr:hypothetical protein [Alphaproteobacteria bacterium]